MISVIVPVYNNEKYIARCLDSVLNQTYHDFEILTINDGSTDRSREILQEYAAKDSRIRYFEQSNQGVSVARNCGIDNAKGEYIHFLDGDDYLASYALEYLFTTMKTYDLDCVSYLLYKIDEQGVVIPPAESENTEQRIYNFDSNKKIADFIDKKAREYFYSSCGHLFKTEIIKKNNIRFSRKLIRGEDTLFAHIYSLFIKRCSLLLGFIGYYYVQNSSSCCHTKNDEWEHVILQYLKRIEELHIYLCDRKNICGGYETANLSWEFLLRFCQLKKKQKNPLVETEILSTPTMRTVICTNILRYAPFRRKLLLLLFLFSQKLFSHILHI